MASENNGDPETAANLLIAIDQTIDSLTAVTQHHKPREVLDRLTQQLSEKTLQIPPVLRSRLQFAICVFLQILNACCLDPSLTTRLANLFAPFVKNALRDDKIYGNRTHSLFRLINVICEQGITWYPQKGRNARVFLEELTAIIDAISQLPLGDSESLAKLQQRFSDFTDAEVKRSDTAEKRCCESEAGHIKVLSIQKSVTSHINGCFVGKMMPPSLAAFIQGPLREELQFVLINQGPKAPLWNRWRGIISTLGWVFVPDRSSLDRQQLYQSVPSIANFLELPIQTQTCSEQAYQEFANNLGQTLMQLLKNEDFECIEVPPLGVPGDLADVKTHVSKSLLKNAEHLSEGDWFLFNNDQNQEIRCKLALKIPETDQLLFVTRYGHKVLQKSIEEFVICLSSKIAKPLSYKPPFELALPVALAELIRTQQQESVQAALSQKKEDRLKAHIQAKQAAAAKAQREAEALAATTQSTHAAPTEKTIQQTLDSLRIGAWVEIPDIQNTPTRCKLAVHIRSTGKFIFVDRIGIKVAERSYEELAVLLRNHQFRILDQGKTFDDQLAKVIRGLRKETN